MEADADEGSRGQTRNGRETSPRHSEANRGELLSKGRVAVERSMQFPPAAPGSVSTNLPGPSRTHKGALNTAGEPQCPLVNLLPACQAFGAAGGRIANVERFAVGVHAERNWRKTFQDEMKNEKKINLPI